MIALFALSVGCATHRPNQPKFEYRLVDNQTGTDMVVYFQNTAITKEVVRVEAPAHSTNKCIIRSFAEYLISEYAYTSGRETYVTRFRVDVFPGVRNILTLMP